MKKLLFISLIITNVMIGQITLEHSYPGSSCYYQMGTSSSIYNQLYVVKLEVDGDKYVHVDRNNKMLKFYNLNHTPFKSISYAAVTDVNPNGNNHTILYISQKLFDNDNEIEFMYGEQLAYGACITQIVNEDGSIVFTANNESNIVISNAPQVQVSIYNTTAGTKMILSANSSDPLGNGKVYSLPGNLSPLTVKSLENPTSESNLYPNPSSDNITLDNKEFDINKVVIMDVTGKIIRSISSENVTSVNVDISTLSCGEYYVQIFDKKENLIDTKKLIKN